MDHQTQGENVKRNANVEKPSETTCPTDRITDDEEKNTRDNLKGAIDISSLGDGEIVDNLQEGYKVAGPAVVGHLICHVQEAR